MGNSENWRVQAGDMVRTQIAVRGVKDGAVCRAMERVPRHLFVPEALRSEAYLDFPLPIGRGQTISQPYIVALMTELLQVAPGMKVLEIGTGSGYQAAVLAEAGARVFSIERIESLARQARKNLVSAGYEVDVLIGDGRQGLPEEASFDRILVTAGAPRVEQAWEDQLAEGGILVLPLSQSPGVERLLVRHKTPGGPAERWYDFCRFVPVLPGVVPEQGADSTGDDQKN